MPRVHLGFHRPHLSAAIDTATTTASNLSHRRSPISERVIYIRKAPIAWAVDGAI